MATAHSSGDPNRPLNPQRSDAAAGSRRWATAIEKAALGVGIVFLLVGIAGFIPGLTTNYGQMGVAGHESMAMLLGIFMVSILHNLVHLAFGIVGIALSTTPGRARNFLIVGGAIYLVLWLYGLIIDQSSRANFVPVNSADNWLHFVLGVGMIGLGVLLGLRLRRSAVS